MPTKHIPLRTCVVCARKVPKRDLVRIVRLPSGSVEVDLDRKKPGRGAYLCHNPECWQQSLKRSRLDYALKGKVPIVDRETLAEYSRGLQENSAN